MNELSEVSSLEPDYPHHEFGEEAVMSWDEFFMDTAYSVSAKSRDPSTVVGCVIATQDNNIVSVGYNAFPRGVKNTAKRWVTRPDKYSFVVHAERNAILNAVRQGRSTLGCKLYLFYDTPPCEQCVLDIIQSGIREIVLGTVPFKGAGAGKWYDVEQINIQNLKEAGVRIRKLEDWKPKFDMEEYRKSKAQKWL